MRNEAEVMMKSELSNTIRQQFLQWMSNRAIDTLSTSNAWNMAEVKALVKYVQH